MASSLYGRSRGAAAAKRYIYHRHQYAISTKALPGLCGYYLKNRNYRFGQNPSPNMPVCVEVVHVSSELARGGSPCGCAEL